MRYLWSNVTDPRRRVMHIARFTSSGEMLWQPLCGRVSLPWNRSINAPFGLGRPICRWCRQALYRAEMPDAQRAAVAALRQALEEGSK